jgi:predicted lipoprotein with Yx(FWY)xxD motif
MKWTIKVARAAVCSAVFATACTGPQQAPHVAGSLAPLATPLGITLQPRAAKRGATGRASGESVFADVDGMTLYIQDASVLKRGCEAQCAQTFVLALASSTAAPVQGWALRVLADRTRQWIYHDSPVYRCTQDKKIGDVECDGAFAGTWHVAAFHPEQETQFPGDLNARETGDALGVVLVDDQGMTLYVFDGGQTGRREPCNDCAGDWAPVEAPVGAASVGDFSVIARTDGIIQWAYHDNSLYRFGGDRKPGDVLGAQRDPRLRPALLTRYFMPDNVSAREHPQLGKILVTTRNETLYERDRMIPGEHHGFREDHGSPALGRTLGTTTCDDECAKTWRPLWAGPSSLPSGYWSLVTRPDGSRQWAYKGFALYTYSADKPGDIKGQEVYELARLGERYIGSIADAGANVGSSEAGQGIGGLVWQAVIP